METIGKIPVLNTRNIVGPTTMMNGLVYNPPKWGKTTFVGSMDRMTRRFGGMGLGLAIAKGIVDMHKGRIWAESEGIGMGASFYVVLPHAGQ